MMRPKINVALVGAAGYGDTCLNALLNDSRNASIRLVGVADPAPQRCRRREDLDRLAVPFYPTFEALLGNESHLDLVILATPIHLHAPHACIAMERAINVLCEKPLAGSLADAKRMLDCEATATPNAAGRRPFLAIGFQWSFNPAILALKHDIRTGLLGRPVRLTSMVSFPRGHEYYCRNDWAGRVRTASGKEVMDSPVNNATAHYLHNMLFVLGDSRETSASPTTIQAELYRANAIENYDTAALRVGVSTTRWGEVEVVFLATQAMAPRVGPLARYEFENATVSHDATTGRGEIMATFKDGSKKCYGDPDVDRNEKIWQCVAAIQSPADSPPPACTARTAFPHTLCVLGVHRSSSVIHPFSPADLISVGVGEDVMVAVRGLESVMTKCFERSALPSELGHVPWARPGKLVDMPNLDLLAPVTANRVAITA